MPLWLVALIYFFFLTLVISVWAALGNNAALATLVIVSLIQISFYIRTTLLTKVDADELYVGLAHIPLRLIGDVKVLNNLDLRRIRTRDADPAAHLAIRFWATEAVQVFINDPRDSTPYWLISTKKGDTLKIALKN